jgi:uncharacterized membrane protein
MAGEVEQGRDLERVGAFSDGVFAIAITVLVLSIHLPSLSHPTETQLRHGLGGLERQVLTYFLSFYVIGTYWYSHHRMWHFLIRIDSRFVALNMLLLSFIALLPFPTQLMGSYGDTTTATVIYAVAVSLTGLASTALWYYVSRENRLLRADTPARYRQMALWRGIAVPIIFGLSIPIAFVDADTAKLFWIVLWPVHAYLSREHRNVYEM